MLDSTGELQGENLSEVKKNLLNHLFSDSIFNLAKQEIKEPNLSFSELNTYLEGLEPEDLDVFLKTPAGRIVYYWLYQSLMLQLTCDNDPAMIEEINITKKLFAETLGNSKARAEVFKDKILEANASIVFTQECDEDTRNILCENGFHSVEEQNVLDGTLVFLKSDIWDRDYQIITLSDYEKNSEGVVNLILAVHSVTREYFLLAAAHGHSTVSEDGRLQIKLIKEAFDGLKKTYPNLHLVIGTDANTKKGEDVSLFQKQLDDLDLVSTQVGATTFKKRYVTMQHTKAGRPAIDEEDYIITLKNDQYPFSNTTVGFKPYDPSVSYENIALPSVENPSDHFAVGTTMNINN